MTSEPKVWLPSEVWDLMAAEMKAYRQDCNLRRVPFSYQEMAECVYLILDQHGLIELNP